MTSANPAKVTCAACGRKYRWQEDYVGRRMRCQCGQAFVMPAAAPREDAPAEEAGPPADAGTQQTCPSCQAPVSATAVLCVACGYNLREGRQLKTETGGIVRASTGPRGKPRHVTAPDPQGLFGRLSRGWALAKISYGILWDFKQLLLFPIFSAAAAMLVTLSFVLPLWGTGTLAQFSAFLEKNGRNQVSPTAYVLAFLYYFACYFVIVFFNTALTACAMKVTAGEAPTLKYGLSVAVKRLPQIVAWALVSALVGLLLKVIENLHEKIGRFIALILGAGWTVLTYFVVPVLAVEGVGPVEAVKRSVRTLKDTWGESLVGNSAMGLVSFLVLLPLLLLVAGGIVAAAMVGSIVLAALVVLVGIVLILLWSAASSAADGVLKALLYNFATGRSMPADIDESEFVGAFASRPLGG